jgi:hypothetical protein
VANVAGLTSSNFHYGEAPPAIGYPHVVFHGDASPFEWDSTTQFEYCNVNFMIYGAEYDDVKTIAAAIKAEFDFSAESTIDASPYGVQQIDRIQEVPARRIGDTWVVNLIYLFVLNQAR